MRTSLFSFFWVVSALTTHSLLAQDVVRVELVVSDTTWERQGHRVHGLAINGSIPGPELHFTEGDSVEITVTNTLHHSTSIHWHGLLLPNSQDGVPYLTTPPVPAMGRFTYRFKLRQTGTYWYHSHTMLQEQSGLYGAFIIHPKNERPTKEKVVLLSDWTDERPEEVERSLHFATDWYAIQKKATQDYGSALLSGHFGTKLMSEWKRMHAMDVSDVYYPAFWVNGQVEEETTQFNPGDTVRLRVINGSSSTYFWLRYAGGQLTVVASDGAEVQPVAVDRLIVGVSETYDVEVVVPAEGMSWEFQATSEDRMGHASLYLGNGHKMKLNPLPTLDYFKGMEMMNDMMDMQGGMVAMDMPMSLQQMDMNQVMYRELQQSATSHTGHGHHMQTSGVQTLNYAMLKAKSNTTLPKNAPWITYHLELNGNMNRYVWSINNKTISESDRLFIPAGTNVRMVLTNNSMMRHPMHLHGHFFRLVNGQGELSPLKTVVDILPMETDTLEFYTNEGPGNWYFHCHILYHMMGGMGRIFTYQGTTHNERLGDSAVAVGQVYGEDSRYYLGADVALESNGSDGEVVFQNTRNEWSAEWRVGFTPSTGYELESHYARYFGKMQWLKAFVGIDTRSREHAAEPDNWFGQSNTKNDRAVVCAGVSYVLPLLVETDLRVDHTGKLRLQMLRDDLAITPRTRAWGMVNSDNEYAFGLRYALAKFWKLSAHYDSDMGIGVGVAFTY